MIDILNKTYSPEHFHPLEHTESNYKIQASQDDAERRMIVMDLNKAINSNLQKNAQSTVELAESIAVLLEGSSMDDAHQVGVAMITRMTQKPAFQQMLQPLGLGQASFTVQSDGQVFALRDIKRENITQWVMLDPELDQDRLVLADIASTSGGLIDQTEVTRVARWLEFHEYDVPKNIAQTQNLIRFLQLEFPTAPVLEDYWEILSSAENAPLYLDDDQRQLIRSLTSGYLQASDSLLEYLLRQVYDTPPRDFSAAECENILDQLGSHYEATSLASALIDELGWYGSQQHQTASTAYLQLVITTAIVLDLHPEIGEGASLTDIAQYQVCSPANAGKLLTSIRAELEQKLISNMGVASAIAPLVAHLCLSDIAPEFLVQGLPATLQLGSVEWVSLRWGVAVAEINAPGSSRLMNYSQVLAITEIEPVSKQMKHVYSFAALEPISDWALINAIINEGDLEQTDSQITARAVSAYDQFLGAHAHAATVMSTPLPTRREIALAALKIYVPTCDFIEEAILFHKDVYNSSAWRIPNILDPVYNAVSADRSYLPMSIVDLYMSNDLSTGKWDRLNQTSIYIDFPILRHLVPLQAIFSDNFDTSYERYKEASVDNIKLMLASMPYEDREHFQRGEVSFFTIRPSVAIRHPGEPGRWLIENQEDKDAATGRYGVVMCAHYQNRLVCYEVFTLQRQCRKNTPLAKIILDSGTYRAVSRLAFAGKPKDYSARVRLHQLPTDAECYTHGTVPRDNISSSAVIEKLGSLPLPESSATSQPGAFQSYHHNRQLDAIANFIQTYRPLASREELRHQATGQTALELERMKVKNNITMAVNILVPFKGCIEDLLSDDSEQQAEGGLLCAVEAVSLLFIVIAAAGKIVSIAVKSMDRGAKAVRMATVGMRLAVSVLNPLDGVPTLIYSGSKLLRKGLLRLGRQGLETLDTATFQLRKLTGSAQSYDLIKASNRHDIMYGTVRKLNQSGNDLHLWVVRESDTLYAFDPRHRILRGGALKEFRINNDLLQIALVGKLAPKSYAKTIMSNAIPIGQRKVNFAISALSKADIDDDSKFVLKALFGSDSDDATEWFLDGLQAINEDYKLLTAANIEIKAFSDGKIMGGLYTNRYNAWRAATTSDLGSHPFIQFSPEPLNNYYRHTKFDDSRIGDLLNHELSHGRQGTQDFIYADITHIDKKKPASIDVSQLLNLAQGPDAVNFSSTNRFRGADLDKLRTPPDEGALSIWSFVEEAPGMLNADSQSLVIALLSQAKTNAPAFSRNVAVLRETLRKAGRQPITDPVRLFIGQGA